MDFEKELDQIRLELNSMSKKIIKLRFAYKILKKSYLQDITRAENKIKDRDLLRTSKYYKHIEKYLKD